MKALSRSLWEVLLADGGIGELPMAFGVSNLAEWLVMPFISMYAPEVGPVCGGLDEEAAPWIGLGVSTRCGEGEDDRGGIGC